MTERGSFRMGERDADDVFDENHEATGFFPGEWPYSCRLPSRHSCRVPSCHTRRSLCVIPAGPSLSCPPALPCHTRRPFPVMPAGLSLSYPPVSPCHTRRPFPVMPARPLPVIPAGPLPVMPAGPSLSYPQAPHCHSRSCKRESRVTFVSRFPFVIVTVIPGWPHCQTRSSPLSFPQL